MKKRKGVLWVLGAVALLAVVLLFRRVHFDWGEVLAAAAACELEAYCGGVALI